MPSTAHVQKEASVSEPFDIFRPESGAFGMEPELRRGRRNINEKIIAGWPYSSVNDLAKAGVPAGTSIEPGDSRPGQDSPFDWVSRYRWARDGLGEPKFGRLPLREQSLRWENKERQVHVRI
jgi:hypothetical protein